MRISDCSSDVCSSDLPVEFISKPGIHPRFFIFIGLVDIHMQQCIVDPFSKKAVTALLHHGRIAAKRISCGGKGFRRHFSLSVNMCRGGGCPVLDVSQIKSEEHTSELQSLMRTSYAV